MVQGVEWALQVQVVEEVMGRSKYNSNKHSNWGYKEVIKSVQLPE